MDATLHAIVRFIGLLLAFVGLHAVVDGTLLLIIPERLPVGELADHSVLQLMVRQLALGCGSLGLGALVLHRTRTPAHADAALPSDAGA